MHKGLSSYSSHLPTVTENTENSGAAIGHQIRQVKGTTAELTQCASSKMNTIFLFTLLF